MLRTTYYNSCLQYTRGPLFRTFHTPCAPAMSNQNALRAVLNHLREACEVLHSALHEENPQDNSAFEHLSTPPQEPLLEQLTPGDVEDMLELFDFKTPNAHPPLRRALFGLQGVPHKPLPLPTPTQFSSPRTWLAARLVADAFHQQHAVPGATCYHVHVTLPLNNHP